MIWYIFVLFWSSCTLWSLHHTRAHDIRQISFLRIFNKFTQSSWSTVAAWRDRCFCSSMQAWNPSISTVHPSHQPWVGWGQWETRKYRIIQMQMARQWYFFLFYQLYNVQTCRYPSIRSGWKPALLHGSRLINSWLSFQFGEEITICSPAHPQVHEWKDPWNQGMYTRIAQPFSVMRRITYPALLLVGSCPSAMAKLIARRWSATTPHGNIGFWSVPYLILDNPAISEIMGWKTSVS